MSPTAQRVVTAATSPSDRVAVELHGAGQVGGAFLRRLRAAGIRVAAVHRSRGSEHWPVPDARRVLVDATPPRLAGQAAEAWVTFLERTLRSRTPVVTCNKAPLALAWGRLADAARDGGVPLLATGTVGGGTPVLPRLRELQARHGTVSAVDATLSGTLAKVLPSVRRGRALAAAIADAQRLGYCEPDPTVDLDGTDAWAKACIVHNALWPDERPFTLADRPGPLRLTEASIRSFAAPAVVARIRAGGIALALQDWAAAAATGIEVRARVPGEVVTITGTGAGPSATAAALLEDVQAVADGALGAGIH